MGVGRWYIGPVWVPYTNSRSDRNRASQGFIPYTNSRAGPRTSLGPALPLTVGGYPRTSLGDPRTLNSRSGPDYVSLGPITLTVGVVQDQACRACQS